MPGEKKDNKNERFDLNISKLHFKVIFIWNVFTFAAGGNFLLVMDEFLICLPEDCYPKKDQYRFKKTQ